MTHESAWNCQRCGREEGPRLDYQPWPGELGERVQRQICSICWREWLGMQTKIINEYRLSVLEPEHTRFLREQMQVFFKFIESPGPAPQLNDIPPA